MKKYILIILLCLHAAFVSAQQTRSDIALQQIVTEQQLLFEKASERIDEENFVDEDISRQLQELNNRWERFISTFPKDVEGRLLYGKFLRAINQHEAAILQFLEADALNPNLAVAKQQMGNYFAEHGFYQEALKSFMQAVDLEPDQAVYHYQLGEVLFRYREHFLADGVFVRKEHDNHMQTAFRRAAELKPDDLNLQLRWAESFYDTEEPDWDTAFGLFERCLDLAESEILEQVIWTHLARVSLHQGKREQAWAYLNKISASSLESSKLEIIKSLELEKAQSDASANPSPTHPPSDNNNG